MELAYVFDTETTGLLSNRLRKDIYQAEVIEYYGCLADIDSGEIKDEFETLIKPRTYPMSTETIEQTKTKLTNDMLFNAPPFVDISDRIRQQIESAPLIIAHNAAFDREIIDIEMNRLGKSIHWPAIMCTIEQTMYLKGFRLSLTDLHLHLFGKAFDDAHRAKHDVHALLRCCVELKRQDLI